MKHTLICAIFTLFPFEVTAQVSDVEQAQIIDEAMMFGRHCCRATELNIQFPIHLSHLR